MYRRRNFEMVTSSSDAPDIKERALEVLKEKEVSPATICSTETTSTN